MIIDTHTHIACADRDAFPLRPSGATAEWWDHGGSIDELLATQDANDVERVVIVQAVGAYGYDCSCASAAVAAHRDRAALVVAVDMSGVDPAAALDALLASDTIITPVGVRLFGVGGASADWLTDGRGTAVIDIATDADLVVVPTVLADRFTELAALAGARTDARFAVDHCGFPGLNTGDVDASWRTLAQLPNVNMKVTSYVCEGAEHTDGDPAPVVERLAELFGAERLCWGSDHPQDTRSDYAGKLTLAQRATRRFDDAARMAFFSGTATRLFF